MWFCRADAINVQDLMTVAHQPVRNHHPMTAKIDSLRAHVGGWRLFGQFDQGGYGTSKFCGQHVIGVVTKTGAAEGDVRRVIADFLTTSAEIFHTNISEPGSGQ